MVLKQESVDSLAHVSARIVRCFFFQEHYQAKIVAQRKRKFRSCMIVHHWYVEVRSGNYRRGNGIGRGHSGERDVTGKTGENDSVMSPCVCLYHRRKPYQICPR